MRTKRPLTLMLSSRCKDSVRLDGQAQPIAALRLRIKQKLEKIQLGGHPIFEVWTHEENSDGSAKLNTWEACLDQARKADIVLALYNGRSGWQGTDKLERDGIGICHAELAEAFERAPGKVCSIQFQQLASAAPGSADAKFQKWFQDQNIPGPQVADGDEALQQACAVAAALVLELARAGVGLSGKGRGHLGDALTWRRLDLRERRQAMTKALREHLGAEPDALPVLHFGTYRVGFVCDAIPGSMSQAAARELVGQPFRRDPEHCADWPADVQGPVHLIACQQGVTETQALRQLGLTDALVVPAPFGVYVADPLQRVQMVFLAHCRDLQSTQRAAQEFRQWLTSSGETDFLAARARVRRKVCELLRTADPGTTEATRQPPTAAKQRKPNR